MGKNRNIVGLLLIIVLSLQSVIGEQKINKPFMKIVAHRGYWKSPEEKNTLQAFQTALLKGYGIEVDVRDYCGEIVISHDLPNENSPKLIALLKFYKEHKSQEVIAFNIKSCGLASRLKEMVLEYNIPEYFVFDMAIPDVFDYQNRKMFPYLRVSEFEEVEFKLLKDSHGIWVDAFNKEFVNYDFLLKIDASKALCFVSPELHKREHIKQWAIILDFCSRSKCNDLAICTDFPDEADKYFNSKN